MQLSEKQFNRFFFTPEISHLEVGLKFAMAAVTKHQRFGILKSSPYFCTALKARCSRSGCQ